MRWLLVLCAVCVCGVLGAITDDLVTSLPGFTGALPSKFYSGLLPVNAAQTRFLHYWFVESEHKPSADPVLLWLNGGPGCSSLTGLLEELGPVHFGDQVQSGSGSGSGVHSRTRAHRSRRHSRADGELPSLVLNAHRWNRVANIIFLESPVGVGFSVDLDGDYTSNDTRTAQENLAFLTSWFAGFPEYQTNDFYITGESYAGIFVPMLAEQVLAHNADTDVTPINLKGVMVGNGCIGTGAGICKFLSNPYYSAQYLVDYFYGHGMMATAPYQELKAAHCDWDHMSDLCEGLWVDANMQLGGFNAYNVYEDCSADPYVNATATATAPLRGHRQPTRGRARGLRSPLYQNRFLQGTTGCVSSDEMPTWLNDASVQSALHVSLHGPVGGAWVLCSKKLQYTYDMPSVLPTYQRLIPQIRVLIFNGDADSVVPYNDNLEWTVGMNYTALKWGLFQPWYVDKKTNEVAGYATLYPHNFTFVTVKGAGHMVAQVKPLAALVMLQNFFSGLF